MSLFPPEVKHCVRHIHKQKKWGYSILDKLPSGEECSSIRVYSIAPSGVDRTIITTQDIRDIKTEYEQREPAGADTSWIRDDYHGATRV